MKALYELYVHNKRTGLTELRYVAVEGVETLSHSSQTIRTLRRNNPDVTAAKLAFMGEVLTYNLDEVAEPNLIRGS